MGKVVVYRLMGEWPDMRTETLKVRYYSDLDQLCDILAEEVGELERNGYRCRQGAGGYDCKKDGDRIVVEIA